ncbi:PREDICTED: uncharacterized protein LOC109329217 [Lupinus angustifolius]|uniref:uncharacterized protein LOC109329217 n=1 Tax=Lupinus angustifolius TaxID=3871 RepID=UPI00092E5E60|nr:PREDICTED: uncharacterized protein LOC109329217 [Lupinus angustifolius]
MPIYMLSLFKAPKKPKKFGGLGIKDLSQFNDALLGKWKWRILVDSDALWVKVIDSKYGTNGVFNSSPSASRWWRDLVKIGTNDDGPDWMEANLWKEIGDGFHTCFWKDIWFGNQTLKDIFPRLFLLALDKDALVAECGVWTNGEWT